MGIYVPKMKMPECCLLCPFEHMMTCSREERYTDIHERQRPEWCPLIEIQDAEKEYNVVKDPDPIDLLRLSYKKAKENDQKRTGEIW